MQEFYKYLLSYWNVKMDIAGIIKETTRLRTAVNVTHRCR